MSITSPQVVDPGSSLTISCNATCAVNSTPVLWYNSSGLIILLDVYRNYDTSSGTIMSYLSLTDFSYTNDAMYTCCAFNTSFCASTIIVVTPTVSPSQLTGRIGDTFSGFTCNFQFSLDAIINWYIYDLEGNFQPLSDESGSGSGDEITELLNNNYNFVNVTFENAGDYQCSLTVTDLGEVYSQSAILTGLIC